MFNRTFFRATIFILFILSVMAIPFQVQAGGSCGGPYTVEKGDTVAELAAMCGTTTTAIFVANPGLVEPLNPGQVIIIPGANFGTATNTAVTSTVTVTSTVGTTTPVTATPTKTATPPFTPTPTLVTPVAGVVNNYYTYNYYNYYNSLPSSVYINASSYTVQAGDTIESIAYSFGLTIQDLLAANPGLSNFNSLYVGQVLNIPAYYLSSPSSATAAAVATVNTTVVSTEQPTKHNYNSEIPKNAAYASINLVNKSEADVYISLRSNRADGTVAINEFPVKRRDQVEIPVGWIDYIAYVGGTKYTGGFQLNEGTLHTITFNRTKVVVD